MVGTMGKLPIEKNYGGRMEELDSQPYLSEGISRRGFLKGAAALTGAAIFGEGLLKQMEAWAQNNGVKVYINSKNLDEGLLMKLESALNRKGIKTTEYVENADIEIKLGIFYKENDADIPAPGLTRHDSATISVKYIKPEGSSESVTYPKINADFLDSYIDSLGDDMARYMINSRSPPRGSRLQNENKSPDKIKMVVDGKERTLIKGPDEKTNKYVKENNQAIIKSLEKDGWKTKLINNEAYYYRID
jgi:hypothetical protein